MTKFVGRSFCFGLFLLVLAVTGREVPEVSRLADDVSNDGQLVEFQSKAAPKVDSQREDQQDRLLFTRNDFFFVENMTDRARIVPLKAGQDLLHSLSLQRK